MHKSNLLSGAASLVLGAFGQIEVAPNPAPSPIRSRKKGAAYRRCFNEHRVGDKLVYYHATKGRRSRRVPA